MEPQTTPTKSHDQSAPPTTQTATPTTTPAPPTDYRQSCSHLCFKLTKNLQIVLMLAEFALTILFIRNDAEMSDKCLTSGDKTLTVILITVSQLIFGIVIILNNCHKFHTRILLPAAVSLVVYLNLRYAYLYLLYVGVHFKDPAPGFSADASCYFPVWMDLFTLVSFHLFLVQLFFYLRFVQRHLAALPEQPAGTEAAPQLALPTYKQVTKNPKKYPEVIDHTLPKYQEAMGQNGSEII